MTDRELLELAAKAAGIASLRWGVDKPERQIAGEGQFIGATWNPLTDNGDALRLAVNLAIHLSNPGQESWAQSYNGAKDEWATTKVAHGGDACAATRRAIVRAAAAIQEAKEAP